MFSKLSLLLSLIYCGDVLSQTKGRGSVECVSTVYPPYVTENDGVIAGIDVDLLVAAGRSVGLEIVPKILPWARVEAELKRGVQSKVDCAFAFSRTPQREAYMLFGTVPLKVTSFTLFARSPRSNKPYTGVAGLKGSRIGVRFAFRVPEEIQQAAQRGELTLDPAHDDESNFRKIALDRVDYVLTNQDVGVTMIRRLAMDDVVALRPSVVELPTFVVFNSTLPQAAAWRAALDKGLKLVRADATEQRIRDLYLH